MKLTRGAKVLLVLIIGLWGAVGALGNLMSMGEMYRDVERVTSMAGVPDGAGPPWRTSSPFVVWGGVLTIFLGKAAAVFGGLLGGSVMLSRIGASSELFQASKQIAVAGCGLAFVLHFAAFTVFAESVFFMFYDRELVGAAELAFRISGSFALAAIFVGQCEPGECRR